MNDRLRREYAERLKQGYLQSGFKQGFEAGYAKAKEDFERPQWIPCSERLPKPNELVVASLKTGVQLCEYLADGSSDSWFSTTDNRFVYNRLIKAWMPLPEPYKEGDPDA